MGVVVSVTNQKGGVGKTMTVACLGSVLTMQGHKVLLIDLDPQRNLDMMAGKDVAIPRDDEKTWSLLHVMKGECSLRDAIVHTAIGDLVRASSFLTQWKGHTLIERREFENLSKEDAYKLMDSRYTATYGKSDSSVLSEKLEELRDEYDYILLDTNPSLMVLTLNALYASDYVLIPVITDGASLDAVIELWNTIQTIRMYNTERQLQVAGILITRYQSNTLAGDLYASKFSNIAAKMNTRLFAQKVRNSTAALECIGVHQDLVRYNKRCVASKDYVAFAEEFKARIAELESCKQKSSPK